MQSRKCVKADEVAYLAMIIEETDKNKRAQGTLVVENFSEIFTDDLSGLPCDRKVEFVIELELVTTPIHRAPYQMASHN